MGAGSNGKPPADTGRGGAAVALLAAHGNAFRRTARRVSLCADDAEDAVQRAAVILLTKAPSLDLSRLAAWMHVVTRREALAVRRDRERLLGRIDDSVAVWAAVDPLDGLESDGLPPSELLERRERARERLLALAGLKPHEQRAIVLQAQGYSYREIADRCGWTHTKVNRCLAEGRERLRRAQ